MSAYELGYSRRSCERDTTSQADAADSSKRRPSSRESDASLAITGDMPQAHAAGDYDYRAILPAARCCAMPLRPPTNGGLLRLGAAHYRLRARARCRLQPPPRPPCSSGDQPLGSSRPPPPPPLRAGCVMPRLTWRRKKTLEVFLLRYSFPPLARSTHYAVSRRFHCHD